MVNIHPHARERMTTCGATETEVIATVEDGEPFPSKFGRTGFRRNFTFNPQWSGRFYASKQVEVYAAREDGDWVVITVLARYF